VIASSALLNSILQLIQSRAADDINMTLETAAVTSQSEAIVGIKAFDFESPVTIAPAAVSPQPAQKLLTVNVTACLSSQQLATLDTNASSSVPVAASSQFTNQVVNVDISASQSIQLATADANASGSVSNLTSEPAAVLPQSIQLLDVSASQSTQHSATSSH
jgi:hypothetical protein